MFIAKLPTPPAGAVSQRVRFFKDGEFSHMSVFGLEQGAVSGSSDLTATVDYGDENGEQVGEVIALTFSDDVPPVPQPAPEPAPPVEPAAPPEETETQPESTEVAQ